MDVVLYNHIPDDTGQIPEMIRAVILAAIYEKRGRCVDTTPDTTFPVSRYFLQKIIVLYILFKN